MNIVKLLILSIGLTVDAFAVSLCKGLETKSSPLKTALVCGAWFSFFQIIFPLIGYLLGAAFDKYIDNFDHWIIFAILLLLGLNLIKEAFSKDSEKIKDDLSFKSMFLLSLAISVDSLAVGITLALDEMNLYLSLIIIAALTFLVTIIGVFIGHKFGQKYKRQATFIGGILLIAIGIEVLIEHLCF